MIHLSIPGVRMFQSGQLTVLVVCNIYFLLVQQRSLPQNQGFVDDIVKLEWLLLVAIRTVSLLWKLVLNAT